MHDSDCDQVQYGIPNLEVVLPPILLVHTETNHESSDGRDSGKV